MEILIEVIKLNLGIVFLMFLPGYFLYLALFGKNGPFGKIGKLLFSFVFSIAIVDIASLFLDRLSIPFTFGSILLVFLSVLVVCYLFYFKKARSCPEENTENEKSDLPKKGWTLFLLVITFSSLARVIYLAPKIIPHTTDSGHHMYWANYIAKFAELPIYGIPDVIIGEHILFGIFSAFTGISVVSAFPAIILFIINLFSLLAVYLLSLEIGKTFLRPSKAYLAAIVSLLAIGVFYAISSPQGKYINGGVVGNLFGNLLIPTIFYLFVKAAREKKAIFAGLAVVLIGVLGYTHHLSTYIFLYVFAGFVLLSLIGYVLLKINRKIEIARIKSFLAIFINIKSIGAGLFLLFILIFIRVPSYLNLSAIDTAVGDPSKSTRVGLTFNNLIHSTGAWRMFYAFLGALFFAIIISLFFKNSQKIKELYHLLDLKKETILTAWFSIALSVAWFGVIFLMSYRPDLLKIDIPSGRIANYLVYPAALLSGFGVYLILAPAGRKLSKSLFAIIVILVLSPGFISGAKDLSEFYPDENRDRSLYVQTFEGSKYLAVKTAIDEKILKDHINLPADSWTKVFLMRGYERPLSRALLKRYEDPTKDRETCTRDMIAIPDSPVGKQCFDETGVEYIILLEGNDTQQFENSPYFTKIFTTGHIVIYQRTN